ncbi:hypothetical protein IWX50DRAFT_55670 [Phyllosticta citricarpa]
MAPDRPPGPWDERARRSGECSRWRGGGGGAPRRRVYEVFAASNACRHSSKNGGYLTIRLALYTSGCKVRSGFLCFSGLAGQSCGRGPEQLDALAGSYLLPLALLFWRRAAAPRLRNSLPPYYNLQSSLRSTIPPLRPVPPRPCATQPSSWPCCLPLDRTLSLLARSSPPRLRLLTATLTTTTTTTQPHLPATRVPGSRLVHPRVHTSAHRDSVMMVHLSTAA